MPATRSFVVVGFVVLACLGPGAHISGAQQPIAIETVFPAQAPRGQSTVLNVAFPGRDLMVQAVEISPSAGVTVSGLKRAAESQGVSWWEMTVDVAKDAAPGNRTLVLVMPMGRTLPARIMIPGHVPGISDLRIVSQSSNPPAVAVQFAAADESGDLGTAPYVWFTMGCGESVVGVVKGHVTARDARSGVVDAVVPDRRAPGRAPPAGACDLSVRATDASGVESNTLKTVVNFKK